MAKILVADDDGIIRILVSHILKSAGYEVDTAEDGMEAYTKFTQQGGYNCILTDCFMPEMNGPDMVRRLRKENYQVPIIMITGGKNGGLLPNNILSVRPMIQGVVGKPFSPQDLVELVKKYAPLEKK